MKHCHAATNHYTTRKGTCQRKVSFNPTLLSTRTLLQAVQRGDCFQRRHGVDVEVGYLVGQPVVLREQRQLTCRSRVWTVWGQLLSIKEGQL